MGKTVTGGSSHEKNIELLTKDQKRFLSEVLSKGTSAKSKSAYQDYLEGKIKAPDMISQGDLSKMLKPSSQAYSDLMSGKAGKEYMKQLSPGIDAYKDILSGKQDKKYWDELGSTRKTYQDLMNVGTDQAAFKTGVVDPMMQQYNQSVLPALQQRFVDSNAGSSSALNQALAASANDLTTQMGSMYLPFMQGQQQTRMQAAQGLSNTVLPYMQQQQQGQLGAASGLAGTIQPYMNSMLQAQLQGAQGAASLTAPYLQYAGLQNDMYNQANANRLSALSGIGGLAGQQTFSPLISKHEGLFGPLIGAGGAIGAAALMSSKEVKENIRDFDKGLEVIKNLEVKIYDFIEDVGGEKDKVGVIAETLPEEIQASISGIKAVDLYGLVGILINAVKQLNEKVEALGEKCQGQ